MYLQVGVLCYKIIYRRLGNIIRPQLQIGAVGKSDAKNYKYYKQDGRYS